MATDCNLRLAMLAGALLAAACAGDEAPAPLVTPATQAPVPAAGGPSIDLDPPVFSGVQRVALLGEGMLRVSWEPARDTRTAAGNLRYHVYHVPELFIELDEITQPLFTTEPGATSVVVDAFLPGRIFVRAVDEAGLLSSLGGTLYQRVERPIVSARDGRPVTTILGCATLGPGRAVCAGEDGFAAHWDRDHWTPLDVPAGVNWRVEPTTDGAFLYSDIGHLYRLGTDDSLTSLDVRFDIAPQLPIRRFTSGPLGLLWWIDSTGTVYVGVPGDFRRMEHPLTLPASEGCARLQTLAFSANSGFAICEDGTVFSARFDQAELRWSSLTVNTPFPMDSAATGVFASDDTSAIFYGPAGIHRVGVGGWTPIVTAGQPLSTLNPNSPVPTQFPQVEASGVVITAATDVGLLQGPDGFFELIAGTELPLAGFTLPSPLESQSGIRIVTTDGSVAWVDNGRRNWEVAPRLLGFVAGATMPDGTLLAATSTSVYRLSGDDWQEIAPLPVSGDGQFSLHFVAPDNAGGGLLAGANSEDGGLFLRQIGSGWSAEPLAVRDVDGERAALERLQESIARDHARTLAAMDPPPVPAPPAPIPPLQPLLARSARSGELGPLAQPVDVDTAPDGRGVMVTEHAVWWRLSGGSWVRLLERAGHIDAVALDAGPSYILVEDGQPFRCVRDVCDEGIPDAAGAPMGVRAVWRDADGLLAMLGDAAVVRFIPSEAGDGPWQDLASVPAGRWEQVLAAPEARLPNGRILGRWSQNGSDLMWLDDGSVFELKEGQWIRQGQIDGGLALWINESGWGILGRNGLLTLAPVPDATF